ncbi:xaa-Arg dipeptidase-like [Haemaphysalis longicornis]
MAAHSEDCQEARKISSQLLSNPEPALSEHRAHDLLCEAFTRLDFTVQPHYVFPTGFRAELQLPPAPEQVRGITIGLACEYDAIPGLGHACGHNLVAAGVWYAAAIIRRRMQLHLAPQEQRVNGRVVVLGTPGTQGGRLSRKARVLQLGGFNGMAALLGLHPAASEPCWSETAEEKYESSQWLEVRFRGETAQEASVLAYWLLGRGAQGSLGPVRASNPCVPPTSAKSQYMLLLPEGEDPDQRRKATQDTLLGVAKAMGCLVEARFWALMKRPHFDCVLEQVYSAVRLGVEQPGPLAKPFWCSDWGAVSQALPCLCAVYTLPDAAGPPCSRSFAEAAGGLLAFEATLEAAEDLATTAMRILLQTNPLPATQTVNKLARSTSLH